VEGEDNCEFLFSPTVESEDAKQQLDKQSEKDELRSALAAGYVTKMIGR
jgi:hypothetical protein